jgi:transcriptional regulator with PAS, ATPase and Fis domain
VDVRVIAASNRDLRKAVEEGRFREDLYYRLRVVEIRIPPLRERRSDIPSLAHHFLDITNKKMGRTLRGFSNAVMDMFTAYDWSGNVRELENEIERAVALAGDEDTVHSDMLSEHLRGGGDDASSSRIEIPQGPNLNNAVDALKRAMILDAMREVGSKTRAAERLGIPRQSLQKMMKRLEIE